MGLDGLTPCGGLKPLLKGQGQEGDTADPHQGMEGAPQQKVQAPTQGAQHQGGSPESQGQRADQSSQRLTHCPSSNTTTLAPIAVIAIALGRMITPNNPSNLRSTTGPSTRKASSAPGVI